MKENKNKGIEIYSLLNKKEITTWKTICNLKGLILRKQLLIILELVYDIDEIAASRSLTILKDLKLIETKAATSGSNAVMIRLTRKGKGINENIDTKMVNPITDTALSNLRQIYKMESLIEILKNKTTGERQAYLYPDQLESVPLLKNKNDYKSCYELYQERYPEYFHMPDLENKIGNELDHFNLYNMMSRECYEKSMELNKKQQNVTVYYYSIHGLKTSLKRKNFKDTLLFIYSMYRRYFYLEGSSNIKRNITVVVHTFDEDEKRYIEKMLNNKHLKGFLESKSYFNKEDVVTLEFVNVDLQKKYKVKRV